MEKLDKVIRDPQIEPGVFKTKTFKPAKHISVGISHEGGVEDYEFTSVKKMVIYYDKSIEFTKTDGNFALIQPPWAFIDVED